MKTLQKFWKDEAGLESVEYAVIAAVLLLGLIVGFRAIRNALTPKLEEIETAVSE
jgi:Flp pilus assembly pilin Flp